MPELYWGLAAGYARLSDPAGALAMVRDAVRTGWRDAAWMEYAPELRLFQKDPAYRRFIRELRKAPPVSFNVP